MIIGTVRPEEALVYDSFEGFQPFHSTPEGDDLSTREPYGSLEVFFHHPTLANGAYASLEDYEDLEAREPFKSGWYWHPCFPGCLPDGEPVGPFASSRQALEDADEWNPEFDD